MDIKLEELANVTIINVKGEFHVGNVGKFEEVWHAQVEKKPKAIAINCKELEYIDSSAIGTLVKFLNNAMSKGCPVRFVIIKSTEGSSRLDENFRENFNQARDYGFIRGVYHFWSNKSTAREQAYYFLEQVHLTDGDLPPVLDIEHKPDDKSVEDFQRDVLTWLHIVEDRYHVKPIIYTYYKFKEQYLSAPVFDDYPYWIAHYYVDKVQYKGKWKFWQHTDAGKLPGIKGYVDFDIYNGSYYDLRQLCIGSNDKDKKLWDNDEEE